jgi:hypothetical protein
MAHTRVAPWKLDLAWEVIPHALLTFTVLCLLRECGMRVRHEGQPAPPVPARQYGLKKLFAWVAGAALISLAWKFLLDQTRDVAWPQTFGIREILIEGVSRSLSLTSIDLVALWATLRCSRLRWRHTWLITIVVLVQTAVWRLADWMVLGRSQRWSDDLLFAGIYDAFYLGPLVTALFVARVAAYRLTGCRIVTQEL